jgi:hypothetical protein
MDRGRAQNRRLVPDYDLVLYASSARGAQARIPRALGETLTCEDRICCD